MRAAAIVLDLGATVAIVVLALRGAIDGHAALAALLAIQAGRLYPRDAAGHEAGKGPPSKLQGPPSGLVTIVVGLGALGLAAAHAFAIDVRSLLFHPSPRKDPQ